MPFDEPLVPRGSAEELARLAELSERLGSSLTATFARGVADGRRFDDTLRKLGRSFVDMSLQAAIAPLRQTLSAGVGSLATALVGGLLGAGAVKPFAKGGVVGAPTFFPLGAGGIGLMGERGAEAILPLARGADGRLGVRGGAPSEPATRIEVHVSTPDAESFRRSEAQVAAALARAVARGRRGA